VIQTIEQSVPTALLYADAASDLALSDLLEDLIGAERSAKSEILQGVAVRERQVKELEGILAEVERSSTVVDREIDDHLYATAEEILDALDDPEADFDRAVADALQLPKLDEMMQERLLAAATELTEKYAEFRADLEIADRMSGGSSAFDALRDEALADHEARRAHAKSVKARRFGRLGVKIAAAIVVVVQPELAPFVAGVAVAAEQLLRDPHAPPSTDPADRHERVTNILAGVAKGQKQIYATALTSQIIDPARRQLVTPLAAELDGLRFIIRSIDKALGYERTTLDRVVVRLKDAQPREVTHVGS
jgi:hypothetical protein